MPEAAGGSEAGGLTGARVLVTGAGGSIGSALAKAVHAAGPARLVLLDSSEQNLYEIDAELETTPGERTHVSVLGDVGDPALVEEVLREHHPGLVLHAAAFKHVPLMERHPLAAVRNNVLGTYRLARAVARRGEARLVLVSTDKAVEPRSVMGASKRLAESVLRSLAAEGGSFRALRLGNVFASRGSVVPRFRSQIARGGPVTVTDREARRHFVSMEEAVRLLLVTAAIEDDGVVFVPRLGDAVTILDLAQDLIREAGRKPFEEIPIVFTGPRPGDKLNEAFVCAGERLEPTRHPDLQRVRDGSPAPRASEWIEELSALVEERAAAEVLKRLTRLVPGYEASATALECAAGACQGQ